MTRQLAGFIASVLMALSVTPIAEAQESGQIFRCADNQYIKDADIAKERGCKLIEGGSIRIVPALRSPALFAECSEGKDGGTVRSQPIDVRSAVKAVRPDAQYLIETSTFVEFVFPSTLLRQDRLLKVWTLLARKSIDCQVNPDYRSQMSTVLIDCSSRTSSTREMISYRNIAGNGEIVRTWRATDSELQFDSVVPGSVGERELDWACNSIKKR